MRWEQPGYVVAFTTRVGGVSDGVYESLNLTAGTGDDPVTQPAPTRVHDRETALTVDPRDRDRQAVRREGEHRQPRLVAPEAVAGLTAATGAVHGRRVHLPVERQPRRVETELGAGAAAVLGHALRELLEDVVRSPELNTRDELLRRAGELLR